LYIAIVWTSRVKDLQAIRENLEKEAGVASVAPNILYAGHIFRTWRDQILVEKAQMSSS